MKVKKKVLLKLTNFLGERNGLVNFLRLTLLINMSHHVMYYL